MNRTTSGANASLLQTWAVAGTFSRTVGSKNAPSAWPPASTVPPAATASSTQRRVRTTFASSTIGPMSVVGSSGSPTFRSLTPATSFSRNASATASWTKIRWTLMHDWPA